MSYSELDLSNAYLIHTFVPAPTQSPLTDMSMMWYNGVFNSYYDASFSDLSKTVLTPYSDFYFGMSVR